MDRRRRDPDSEIADFLRRRSDVRTPPDLLDEAMHRAALTPQRRKSWSLARAVAALTATGAATAAVWAFLVISSHPPPSAPRAPATTAPQPASIVTAGDLVIASSPVQVTRAAGDRRQDAHLDRPAFVIDDAIERNGEVWIRVQLPTDELHPFAWLIFPDSVSARRELAEVSPRCPDESPVPIATIADLTAAERLLCLQGEPILLGEGALIDAEESTGLGGPPPWLIEHQGAELGVYATTVDPSEYVGLRVGLRGHVDDASAADCERPAPPTGQTETVAEQTLWCRQRFVFDGAERLAP